MKNNLLILLAFLFSIPGLYAQDIVVKSFKKDVNSLDARVHEVKNDFNGRKAAIIKVVTTEQGFSFDVGTMGVVDVVQKPGEIWVYVPAGIQKITINHSSLGILRDYYFDLSIREADVYIMELATGSVRTVVDVDVGGQYFFLTVSPSDAIVTIDEGTPEVLTNGVLQKMLKYGKHTYSISAPLHRSIGGQIEIGNTKVEKNIILEPAFDYLKITTEPENGADIYIDNIKVGTSPLITRRISEGSHTIRAVKNLYQPVEETIHVAGKGDTIPFSVTLPANFANVQIKTSFDANIWINGEHRETGYWEGRLTEGFYKIESRKSSHISTVQTIEIKKNVDQQIELLPPTPRYGILQVEAPHLTGVTVWLDGEQVGNAPDIFRNVLIGKYSLEMRKENYESFFQDIFIEEGTITKVNGVLKQEEWAEVEIKTSDKASIIIDNNIYPSSFNGKLKIGKHTITLRYKDFTHTEEIQVQHGVNDFNFPLEGTVHIQTIPSKAQISIDGEKVGTGPITLKRLDSYMIKVSKGERYESLSASETIEPLSVVNKTYTLKKDIKTKAFASYVYSPSSVIGLQFGIYRIFGWYGKFQIGVTAWENIDWDIDPKTVKGITTDTEIKRLSFTTGAIYSPYENLCLYTGLGYGKYAEFGSGNLKEDHTYISAYCMEQSKGLEVEAGLMVNIKGAVLSIGYSTIFNKINGDNKYFGDIHLGIGYNFLVGK